MKCIPGLFIIFMMLFGMQSQAQREAATGILGIGLVYLLTIILGNRNTQIYFYETSAAAVVDSLFENAISEIYTNKAACQLSYAKLSQ